MIDCSNVLSSKWKASTKEVHIGLDDLKVDHRYEWSDGSLVTWAKWHSSQPNKPGIEHCGGIYSGWIYDMPCTFQKRFVCEVIPGRYIL